MPAAKTRSTPKRLTPQREYFAKEYIRLGNASRAYRSAYNVGPKTKPETIWNEAHRLIRDPDVSRRIEELRALIEKRSTISQAAILHNLDQARELAMVIEKPSAAVSASAVQARIAGHLAPTRLEHSGPDGAAIQVEEQLTVEDRSRYDFARRVALLLGKGKRQLKIAGPSE